jgi:hypothetical protein
VVLVVWLGTAGICVAGCPAGEQGEGVLGGGAGFGQVGDQADAGAGLDGEGLERQVEVADDRVVQPFMPVLWMRTS